jgi:hypothetical protein
MLVPSQLKSTKIEGDLEFEWLLCLASTLKAFQCLQPAEAGEALRTLGFPHSITRIFLERLCKNAFNRAPKEK